jgi:hypothetical protein
MTIDIEKPKIMTLTRPSRRCKATPMLDKDELTDCVSGKEVFIKFLIFKFAKHHTGAKEHISSVARTEPRYVGSTFEHAEDIVDAIL